MCISTIQHFLLVGIWTKISANNFNQVCYYYVELFQITSNGVINNFFHRRNGFESSIMFVKTWLSVIQLTALPDESIVFVTTNLFREHENMNDNEVRCRMVNIF